jgi:hypothetical protein
VTTVDGEMLSLLYGQLEELDIGPTWILLRRGTDGAQRWFAFQRSRAVDANVLAGWLISEHVAVEDAQELAEGFAARHSDLFLERGGPL